VLLELGPRLRELELELALVQLGPQVRLGQRERQALRVRREPRALRGQQVQLVQLAPLEVRER